MLFYAIGNLPMGIGVFLCNPLCKRLGRTRAMVGGLLLSCGGLGVCLAFPTSLPAVLVGQFIKACGTIPSTYLASVLLSEALDDVQAKSGVRCDGFTSSLYNSMLTITSGVAVSLLNGGMALFGLLGTSRGSHPHPAPGRAGVLHLLPAGRPLAGLSRLGRLALRHGEEPRLCQGGEGGGVNGHVSRFAPNRTLCQDSSGVLALLASYHISLNKAQQAIQHGTDSIR